MKFKNDPAGDQARSLRLTDRDGEEICIMADPSDAVQVYFMVNNGSDRFGCTRKKAIKLAWAILDELEPEA